MLVVLDLVYDVPPRTHADVPHEDVLLGFTGTWWGIVLGGRI